MSTRVLKWLSVVVPVGFMVTVLFVRGRLGPPGQSLEGDLYAVLAVALGAVIYSIFVFDVIEGREEEIKQRSLQLEALHEAALALTTELDLQTVLQKVVDLSRELLDAKYGALGVLEPDGRYIAQFITSGITNEDRARIGNPPRGHGLLGVLSPGGQALLVDDIDKDPRSVGFPPNHPPMKSLLGVPIKSKGEIFGNIYLADKLEINLLDEEVLVNFDHSDMQLLEKFATQAAIAIENAQLYRQTQELAVLKERERFRMDLHDGIMQSVYATGLSLQEAESGIRAKPAESRRRIKQAIEDLSQVMRDLRNYILGLQPERFRQMDLVRGLEEMARELRANTFLTVQFDVKGKVVKLSEAQATEVMHIAQEAFTNIRKHAQARKVQMKLEQKNGQVLLTIDDDGVGFQPKRQTGDGNGLLNMRERAQALGGNIEIKARTGKGTRVRLSLDAPETAEVNA